MNQWEKVRLQVLNIMVIVLMIPVFNIHVSAQNTSSDISQSISPIGKPRLLVFSGSDWCLPCIRFDREVLQNPTFQAYAANNIQIEILDFPQHKKLTVAEVKHNEKLAEKYNPNGYFPFVILLDSNGNLLTSIQTTKASPDNVIAQIKSFIPEEVEREFSRSLILMGSAFRITIVIDESHREEYLNICTQKIQEIESWLSSWKEESTTSELNKKAWEKPIKVSSEYYKLVQRCISISELTQGAFDISFNGLSDLYTFDKLDHPLPAQAEIYNRLNHVGYKKIRLLENNTIQFSDSLLKIGFGAIGKGYAAEQVKQLMIKKGVKGGVINASGDLTTWGTNASGLPWKVGVPDPENLSNIMLWLPVENKAIATSGDYEKYFVHNGTHYSHIINPKTGKPVIGSRSVSIISDSAELSDALATAVSVLGLDVGMNLVNQLDGVECVFIDINRNLHFSNGLKTYAY